jgi:K+-sensing histidine kinase KdpD
LAIRQTAQRWKRDRRENKPAESQIAKILVNVTADPSTAMLLRRARRVADHLQVLASRCTIKEESAAVHAEDRPTWIVTCGSPKNLHPPRSSTAAARNPG